MIFRARGLVGLAASPAGRSRGISPACCSFTNRTEPSVKAGPALPEGAREPDGRAGAVVEGDSSATSDSHPPTLNTSPTARHIKPIRGESARGRRREHKDTDRMG